MLQKHLKFNFAFAIVFISQLLLEIYPDAVELILSDFHYAIKPLITIFLMIYLASHTKFKGRFTKRIGVGLFFGLIGDVLLMFLDIEPSFFIFGLAAFLIGHLCYISAFFIDYRNLPKVNKKILLFSVLIFGAFCIGFYWYLKNYLGELEIPVAIYALIISLMATMATGRWGKVNSISFNLIFIGALLFLISDSILAYHKFVAQFRHAGVFIMATYMLAQYFITIGAIERKVKKHAVGKTNDE